MKKKDLKTGMRVVTRNGEVYFVLFNVEGFGTKNDILFGKYGWLSLANYNDNLLRKDTCGDSLEFDIERVDKPILKDFSSLEMCRRVLNETSENYKLIWERKEDEGALYEKMVNDSQKHFLLSNLKFKIMKLIEEEQKKYKD